MKKFLFLIPVLFLFVGCWIDSSIDTYVKNNTSYTVQVYYTENPDTIYTLESGKTITIHRSTAGGIIGVNLPENVKVSSIDGYNYEIIEKTLNTYTVYNVFSVPITFNYNNQTTIINPGEYFSFQSYSLTYSFSYSFSNKTIIGKNEDLIITCN